MSFTKQLNHSLISTIPRFSLFINTRHLFTTIYYPPTLNRTHISLLQTAQYRFSSRFTQEEVAGHREIEKWFTLFDKSHIPRDTIDLSFARSSGPGGQNVNKVSSKAQIKFNIDHAKWIHPKVITKIKQQQQRYINNNNEFIMTSEVHREQSKNIDECFEKLYDVIKQASAVPQETSQQQKNKVEKLILAQKQKDLEFKKRLKEKKSDRRLK